MFSIVIIVLLIAVGVLLVLASKQPEEFQITRSAHIAAPAEAIFPLVNDLQRWDAWSPWAKLDPNAENHFAGPQAGVGASMRWSGNHKVGVGSMTIVESCPNQLIRFELVFVKPFKANNTAEFTFSADGSGTRIVWRMAGKNNFIGKIMSVVMNCDRMVGSQFEQGLAAIKTIVEAIDQPTSADLV